MFLIKVGSNEQCLDSKVDAGYFMLFMAKLSNGVHEAMWSLQASCSPSSLHESDNCQTVVA